LFNLILNENMKIYRRVRTWILVGILIAMVFLVTIIIKKTMPDLESTSWQEMYKNEIASAQQELSARGDSMMDIEKSMLEKKLKINQYALEHEIPPVEYTMWGNAKEVILSLLQMVTIFVVIIAGDMVASEFTWGTIKLLLIRPVNRTKILLSKYLATFIFALFLLTILFIAAFIVSGLFFGFEDISIPHLYLDEDGQVREGSMLLYLLQTYGLKTVELVMIVTIAFMISTIFRSSSLSIGISLFILFTGELATIMLINYFDWGKYFLFANTDLTQYLDGTPLVEGMTMSFSITVLVIHFILFNFLSYYIFKKRDVAA
jgi:ABC-2 type transport system permease protein